MNEDIPEDYIKRVTSTVPFGYELSEYQGYLKPIEKEINSLRLATGMIAVSYTHLTLPTKRIV